MTRKTAFLEQKNSDYHLKIGSLNSKAINYIFLFKWYYFATKQCAFSSIKPYIAKEKCCYGITKYEGHPISNANSPVISSFLVIS